jgi:hypothetical protein
MVRPLVPLRENISFAGMRNHPRLTGISSDANDAAGVIGIQPRERTTGARMKSDHPR